MSQSVPPREPTPDPEDSSTAATSEPPDGPIPLRVAVLALWIEAGALAVLAVVELVKVVTSEPDNPGMAAATAALVGAVAYAVWRLSGALVSRFSWARGPAVVLQLLAVPVAFFMVVGESGPLVKVVGVVLGLFCLVTAGLLLAPSSRSALARR